MRMHNEFDYIIIGAGSAGCVLANRLSSDLNAEVLLLEAGPKDRSHFIHMPVGIAQLLTHKRLNWNYTTTAQSAMGQRKIPVPRGRTLGGSSAINAMVHIRGQAQDYDEWRDLGNKGWGYDDVLPYFKRSETNHGATLDVGYHGHNGPLHITDRLYTHPLSDQFVESAMAAGLSHNQDFNGHQQAGVGRYQVTQKDGKRCSSAVAFLHPLADRPNLTIITKAKVRRILFEGTRAVGVEYQIDHQVDQAMASTEVLLSAGAIGSPQLLLLSGIGPAEELAQHDIPVVMDVPGVGKNLQDHLNVSVLAPTKEPISLHGIDKGLKAATTALQYFWNKSGPGTTNAAESGGFYSSKFSPERPDIQLHFIPLMVYPNSLEDINQHGVTIHACNLRPTDTGEITLASADHRQAPLIDPRFLHTQGNIDRMREGINISREILASGPFADLISHAYSPDKNCQGDAALDAYIRAHAETEYHPVSSCRMGPDDMSVVDDTLAVKGIQSLRVVDASIMPKLISGNTNATCIMIAEKAASLILRREVLQS
jgi:choline dehydrogenase